MIREFLFGLAFMATLFALVAFLLAM